MKRRGRSVLGAVGGILWGAGSAVLIQQYGLWPLDPALAYGAPLAGAAISGMWGRRAGHATAAFALVMLPVAVVALQQARCEAFLFTESGEARLADTAPNSPFPIDPDEDGSIHIRVEGGDDFEGSEGEVWIEFAGIRTFQLRGVVRGGGLEAEYDLQDNGFTDLGGAPGTYHIGGSIEGTCSVDGYVRIAGNPLQGPVGLGGSGAIGVGLLLTWVAGRPGAAVPTVTRRTGKLRPNGQPLRVDGVEIRSPGLEGEATVHDPSETVTHTVARWSDETREAFARHHLEPEHVIEITNSAETPMPAGSPEIVTHHGERALQLDLTNPGADKAQVVMATDESGVVTWHLPRLENGAIDALRHNPKCVYRIASAVTPSRDPLSRRGVAEAFGSKVLSSLVFPILDPLFGHVGERFARVWESRRRPYRFRTFTPDDYDLDDSDLDVIAEPDWDRLAGGKALLFVHGTFSRTHTGFGGLDVDTVEQLDRLYDGRVFAFDHFTLSDGPKQNIAWFFDNLPPEIRLDVDIVCHSRGGLVSRVLAEKQAEMAVGGRRVDVGKIVFAGSPNAGTILAEPMYIGDLIDSYTNLLNFLPGPAVVDVMESLITAIKHLAVGAAGGLDGLQAMRPGGEFLTWLNTTAPNRARYFAVAGDYEPRDRGWRRFAADRLMDKIFDEANDLVVPTTGIYAANGSNHFPITARHEFHGDDGVDHTGYFASKRVQDRLLEWLREA